MGRIDLRKKISLIVAATVVAGNLAFADGAKNCITDVKFSNDGTNVKVNIYTDKPYADSVVVSKKEGNKYVILVPETTSALKSTPKVTGGGNVSVSMQSVNAGKGYTKITITADKSINVLPKTITATPVSKPVAQTPKPVVQQQNLSQPTTPAVKPTQQTASKPVQKQVVAQKPVTKPAVQPKSAPKSKVVQSKPVAAVPVKPTSAPTSDISTRNKPLEILQNEVETGNYSDIKEQKADALLEKTINENDRIIKERKLSKRVNKKFRGPIVDPNLSAKECIKLVIKEVQTLSLWKLLLLASAISFPIVVIMVILGLDKKINKRINAIKRDEDDVAIVERALRENVEAVRAQKMAQEQQQSQVVEPEILSNQSFSTMDEMLDKVEETPTLSDTYTAPVLEDSIESEAIVDSDFELDEPMEDYANEGSSIDDFDTTSSLDEFMLENYPQEEVSAELVPFNPDGVLADYSNVSDKEFFDELVLQSFAQTDVSLLPENVPADEIFNVMTEDESGILLSDFEHANFEQDSYDESAPAYDDDVTMLNEVKINDKTGLYLVSYDNSSSLVGHISDEYFVLKKFDGLVKGKIVLKQTEASDDSTKYLVRVGRNKMIVEVDDSSMSRLIDL